MLWLGLPSIAQARSLPGLMTARRARHVTSPVKVIQRPHPLFASHLHLYPSACVVVKLPKWFSRPGLHLSTRATCPQISAASLVVGPEPARAARAQIPRTQYDCLLSFGRLIHFPKLQTGKITSAVTNCRQKTTAKRAAPKRTGRASRVVEDSDDEEEDAT
jgi:hypothetical protein